MKRTILALALLLPSLSLAQSFDEACNKLAHFGAEVIMGKHMGISQAQQVNVVRGEQFPARVSNMLLVVVEGAYNHPPAAKPVYAALKYSDVVYKKCMENK